MPLYEYQCKSCHTKTERIQKFSDPPLTVCPHCGGEMEQLLSAPAAHFKGSGWYVTDYAKGSSRGGSSGNGSNSPSSGEGKSEGSKSEGAAKPETSSSSAEKSSSGSDKSGGDK